MDADTEIIGLDPLCGRPITRGMYARHTTLLEARAAELRAQLAPWVGLLLTLDQEIVLRQATILLAPPLEMPR